MKITDYSGVLLCETSGKGRAYGFLKVNGTVKALLSGRRQIRRAGEILAVLERRRIDAARLDGRFFAAFSLYLCEEKDFNFELLSKLLRSFL